MAKLLAPLLLASAVVIVGCGKSELDKFGDEYKPVNDRLLALGAKLGRDLRAVPRRSPVQNAKSFSDAAKETGAVRRALAALDPTPEVEANLSKLTAALGEGQKKLANLAARAGAKEKLSFGDVVKEFGPVARRIDNAQNALAGATGARAN